jgi:hypothetical protein
MATVSTKMVLDTTGFNRSIKSAESSMSKFKAVAGRAALAGVAAGFAAATAAAAGLAVGINSAIQVGARLDDLAARTGLAAGQARILEKAFVLAGMSADQVGPVINKMQKAIVDAGSGSGAASESFQRLGLSAAQLSGLTADEQIRAIGAAISALENPTDRAAAAMDLFGRAGGQLLPLFADAGTLNEAANFIGDQAEILTRNAAMFGKAADYLEAIGEKLGGLFIGVADNLVPAIMPMLEALASIDLAGLGQDFGEGIAFALTAITSGQIGNLLTAQLKLSGAQFINTLVSGLLGLLTIVSTTFQQIPENFVTLLGVATKPEFWAGVGLGLLSAAQKFAAIINGAAAALLEAISKVPGLGAVGGLAATFRESQSSLEASSSANAAAAGENLAGPMATLRDQMTRNIDELMVNLAETMAGVGNAIDTAELEAARDAIVGGITEQMQIVQEQNRARFEATKTATPLFDGEGMAGAGRSNTGIIAQSLQKVGGGAAFARFSDAANPAAQAVREQQKTNGFLARIEQKLTPQSAALMPA